MKNLKGIVFFTFVLCVVCTCTFAQDLSLRYDEGTEKISVFNGGNQLLLVQNAQSGVRPYIHPIIAPDGNGVLTEFSPSHHKHQTGLYWGLKKANGRDYFMNWKEDYWRKVSSRIIVERGSQVEWQTVYDLLDEKGDAVLTETQNWSMKESNDKYIIDLVWRGDAKKDITIEKFYVGGLFIRMPWREGIAGNVINSEGKRKSEAEGQRAHWNDIGMPIDGRTNHAHIAILEHPSNTGFPNAWRVDNELGVGPSRQILGDWSIANGKHEVIKYRLVVYTGDFNEKDVARWWKEYSRKQ
jgi:hypothetical protein